MSFINNNHLLHHLRHPTLFHRHRTPSTETIKRAPKRAPKYSNATSASNRSPQSTSSKSTSVFTQARFRLPSFNSLIPHSVTRHKISVNQRTLKSRFTSRTLVPRRSGTFIRSFIILITKFLPSDINRRDALQMREVRQGFLLPAVVSQAHELPQRREAVSGFCE